MIGQQTVKVMDNPASRRHTRRRHDDRRPVQAGESFRLLDVADLGDAPGIERIVEVGEPVDDLRVPPLDGVAIDRQR